LLGDSQLTTSSSNLTSALSRFTALQSLTLGRTESSSSLAGGLLPPALLDCLASLPSLSTLALQKVALAAAEAAALPGQLSRLVFDGCTLPADMQLAHMTQLLELDMVGPQPPQHPSLEVSAGVCREEEGAGCCLQWQQLTVVLCRTQQPFYLHVVC
jgi:hypothetical protein